MSDMYHGHTKGKASEESAKNSLVVTQHMDRAIEDAMTSAFDLVEERENGKPPPHQVAADILRGFHRSLAFHAAQQEDKLLKLYMNLGADGAEIGKLIRKAREDAFREGHDHYQLHEKCGCAKHGGCQHTKS